MNYTLNDIKDSYPQTKRDLDNKNIIGRYLYRPLSFYIAYISLKLKLSANTITWLSILIGGLGCIFLTNYNSTSQIIGFFLIFTWSVFDYADGNIARVMKLNKKYGEFLDAFGGYLISCFFYLSIGVGAYFNNYNQNASLSPLLTSGNIFLLSALISNVSLLEYLIYNKYANIFNFKEYSDLGKSDKKSIFEPLFLIAFNIHNVSGLSLYLYLLCHLLKLVGIYILIYFIISVLVFLGVFVRIWTEIRGE